MSMVKPFPTAPSLHICFYLDEAHVLMGILSGVMAARGLMTNPALYSGAAKCPWGAIERFLNYNMKSPLPYRFALHHISEMMTDMVPRRERTLMVDNCKTIVELIDWLDERYVLRRDGEEGFGERVELERK